MAQIAGQRDVQRADVTAPRFSLRTLLIVISGLCCAFALMSALGMVWSLVIVLVVALVGGHVLGNSLGTRLREEATRQMVDDHLLRLRAPGPAPPEMAAPKLARCARLHRMIAMASLLGAAAGADLGGVLAAYTYPEAPSTAVALGAISMAVLGGFVGFGASSFVSIAQQALREAHAAQPGDRQT